MIMKISYLLACLSTLLISLHSFSQTETNTLPESGNIGIGTITPSEKLDVNGSVNIDSSLVIGDSIIIRKSARVSEDMTVGGNTSLQAAAVAADLKVEGNIVYSGAQGGAASQTSSILWMDPSNKIVKVIATEGLNATLYSFATCRPNNPTWANGLNKLFVNCPLINVGIRTDSPRVPLDVIGAANVTSLTVGGDPQTPGAKLHVRTQSTGTYPAFLIDSPTRKLFQVTNDGVVSAREVKIDIAAWPDYVFKSEYNLMPLTEVAKFIETEGHLPNVPSAEIVECEGINVGEMNKVLMQKIEELTLYMIEQEKRMDEQNKRIQALEAGQQH
jgi:hypothetical protein